VAYRLGLKGVVVGEGSSYEEALADVKSAIRFHIETFGAEVLSDDSPLLEAFVGGSNHSSVMAKFPVDAPQSRVIAAIFRAPTTKPEPKYAYKNLGPQMNTDKHG
jgi:predicted RNase H-like HicB family nuclease